MSLLALGTPVVFTQQAAIARKGNAEMLNKGWFLPAKGNGLIPSGLTAELTNFFQKQVSFVDAEGKIIDEKKLAQFNRVVAVWDQPGSGVVCGLETKQYGITHAGRFSNSAFGEDYDQGYLETHGAVKLYVVRWRLETKDFVYVPPWAITPIAHGVSA